MLTRRFGKTNLQLPVFSCGGMRFQYKWQDTPLAQIPPDNQANLEATIRRSLELGITHIETARGYGSSERQLGVLLPKIPRDQFILQTKIAPEKNPDTFTKHFEESLSRLNLDHVDLLAIHGINDDETAADSIGTDGKGGCLAAARKMQKRGLAKHIGFSTHAPLRIILDLLRHERDGGFDYINLHWYYIFQNNWPAIEEAAKRDIGVFIISPADKGGKLYDPPQKLVDLCKPLHPIAFNALFCLARPEVHTLSIGAARPADFDDALTALPFLSTAADVAAPIAKRLDTAITAAVEPDLVNPFNLNLPEWQNTPGHLNIPVILWLRNLQKALDMQSYGEMRYNLLGNGGHWFPGLNAANIEKLDLSGVAQQSGIPATRLKTLLQESHDLFGKQKVKRLSQS